VSLLQIEDLDSRYGLLQAVRGVSFQVEQGEIIALIGANGAGKTTLLRSVAGAHRPHAGRVVFNGVDISGLRAHDRDQIDRFTARVPHLPAVLSTFHTSGSVDYLLHIAVASTEDLRDWVLDNLATDPVVGHTETTLVFEHIQGNHGPLPD